MERGWLKEAIIVQKARFNIYFPFSFRFFKKGSCQLLAKYVHEVLVNRLGGLSLPRKSVVRLTDRPDMTLGVYRGRKTTIQYNNHLYIYIKKKKKKIYR